MTRTAGKRGRLPVKPPAERFPLRYVHEYLSEPLPAPQYPVDVSGGITDWEMLGNGPDPTCTTHPQGVGDCYFAARQHYAMAKAVADGAPMPTETSNQLVAEYLRYDHGQDVGVNVADVLLAEYRAGTILGFAPVDHTDREGSDAAMAKFHGLLLGADLTDDVDYLFENHETWTTANGETPDPNEGHCLLRVKSSGPGAHATSTDITWGAEQESTAAWDAACIQEAWAVILSEDEIDPAALAALRADIDALGGTGGSGPAAPDPHGLLHDVATMAREVAAGTGREISEVISLLHSHGY